MLEASVQFHADDFRDLRPELVTMENVPGLLEHPSFEELLDTLRTSGYSVDYGVLDCVDFGIPQTRRRLVLVASLVGEAKLPTGWPNGGKRTVREAIGHLTPFELVRRIRTIPSTRRPASLPSTSLV